MAGRPSKLSGELIESICAEIRDGLPITYSCDLFGITKMSFSNWMRRGEADYEAEDYESLYAQFFYGIKKAQAEYVKSAKKEIRSGRVGWQGEAWWLERTRHDFMPKQAIETNSEDGRVTVVLGGKVKSVSKEEAEAKKA